MRRALGELCRCNYAVISAFAQPCPCPVWNGDFLAAPLAGAESTLVYTHARASRITKRASQRLCAVAGLPVAVPLPLFDQWAVLKDHLLRRDVVRDADRWLPSQQPNL